MQRSSLCAGPRYWPAPRLWAAAHFSPHLTHIAQQHCNWWIVQHYIKWRSSRGSPHFVNFPCRIFFFFFLPSYWSELMSCCCRDPVSDAPIFSLFLCLATPANEGRFEGARGRAWEEHGRQTAAEEPNTQPQGGLHNLQTTHTLQVRITTDKHIYSHLVFMFMWFWKCLY